MYYVRQSSAEAIFSLGQVTILPVAFPQFVPGIHKVRVQLHGFTQGLLRLLVELGQDIEGLALQVQELGPYKVTYGVF